MSANQRVNLNVKSYAPIVATLLPSSYPYRYVLRRNYW